MFSYLLLNSWTVIFVCSPRFACRLREMWSRAVWWSTSSTSTRRRGQEDCGRYREPGKCLIWIDNWSQCPLLKTLNLAMFFFCIRASLSQLSGQLLWSGSSYQSMTSRRSIWSCRVTWGTLCTHISCEFAEWLRIPLLSCDNVTWRKLLVSIRQYSILIC